MKKEIIKNLKKIGLTSVILNGKVQRDSNNKVLVGLLGDWSNCKYDSRNEEVKQHIIEVLYINKYVITEQTSNMVAFSNGDETVKFTLTSFNSNSNTEIFWWVKN